LGIKVGGIEGGIVDDVEGGVEGVGGSGGSVRCGEGEESGAGGGGRGAGVEEISESVDLCRGKCTGGGKGRPGETPVVRLTRLATVAKALEKPWMLVADAPRLSLVVKNWARPQAVAAVVTSLMTIDDAVT
jgi:hypothetical protein